MAAIEISRYIDLRRIDYHVAATRPRISSHASATPGSDAGAAFTSTRGNAEVEGLQASAGPASAARVAVRSGAAAIERNGCVGTLAAYAPARAAAVGAVYVIDVKAAAAAAVAPLVAGSKEVALSPRAAATTRDNGREARRYDATENATGSAAAAAAYPGRENPIRTRGRSGFARCGEGTRRERGAKPTVTIPSEACRGCASLSPSYVKAPGRSRWEPTRRCAPLCRW